MGLINGDLRTVSKEKGTYHNIHTTHHKPIVAINLVKVVTGVRFQSQDQSHVGSEVALPKVPFIYISVKRSVCANYYTVVL